MALYSSESFEFLDEWLDELIESGNRKRTSYEIVTECEMDALKHVTTNEWRLNDFRQCGHRVTLFPLKFAPL